MNDLYKANLILDDIFVFDENGDMEKSHLEVKNTPLDWDFCPNGDQEWTFMLNRFTYLDVLSRAYRESSDPVYINKGLALIEDWIDKVKLIPSKKTRTLDTGMRIYHFIKFLTDNKIDDKNLLNKIDQSIKDQIFYLKDQYIEKYDLSNWGLVQVIAIAIAGLYFKNDQMYEKAMEKYEEMMAIQYMDDHSIHWERCLGYHNFMVLWLLRLSEYEKACGLEISHKDQLRKIVETTLITTDLDGKELNNGDSDLTDTGFLLDYYKEIFEEDIKVGSQKLFGDYGLYVEKKAGAFLASFNQNMASNHSHGDFTHFTYQKDGIRILDGGRYTYTESKEREYLKLFAHNNVIVDDKSSMGYVSSWETNAYPLINPIYYKKNRHTFVEMSYFDNSREIFSKRRMFFLENGDLIVFDQIKAKGRHRAKTNILAKGLNDENIMVNRDFSLGDDGYYSTEYNSLEPCQKLSINEDFEDTYTQCIIFGNKDEYEFTEVSRNKVDLTEDEAVAIKTKDGVIVNIFEEITNSPRVFTAGGIKFHARSAVLYGQSDIEIYK